MKFKCKVDREELILWVEAIGMIVLVATLLTACMYLYNEGAFPHLGEMFKW